VPHRSRGAENTAGRPRDNHDRRGELAGRHGSYLATIALRLTGDKEHANQLVEQTLARCVDSELGSNARASLVAILTRLNNELVRQEKVTGTGEARRSTSEFAAPDIDMTVSEVTDAELRDAVHALPSALRDVVEHCYVQELTYKQAAERLNITVATVEMRLKRARERLKELLPPETS
jgi:RNA polymerase sigma-70 factor (ECF subfamily)